MRCGFWPVLLGLVALTGCQVSEFALRAVDGSRPVRVVTTTNFVTDLVQQVGGERVRVTGLMGPGVDPHLYKASAGDVRRLAEADIVFYCGLHLEGKMVELFQRMPKAFAVTDTVPREQLLTVEGRGGGQVAYDPHVWFDVSLWAHTVEAVQRGLSLVDPQGADCYAAQASRYQARLGELDTWVAQEIQRIPAARRVMVTAHDAFAYFGRRYGLEVHGLQGVSTAAEAGAHDVRQLADFLAQRGIPAIFVESSVPRRAVEAVVAAVRARGGQLTVGGELFSDAAGSPGTPEGTYTGMVEHNVRTLVLALTGGNLR